MSEQDFAHALELYRVNYLQYKTTGRSEYKIAYENAETWIQAYLTSVSDRITTGRAFVNTFLQNYSTANPDLDKLKRRFTEIRKVGPEVEDEYTTVKRINDAAAETSVETTSYYIKGGVLMALVGAIFVLSTL
jgi:hypothetical protein